MRYPTDRERELQLAALRGEGQASLPARTAPPKPSETKVLSSMIGKMMAPMAVPAAAMPSISDRFLRK